MKTEKVETPKVYTAIVRTMEDVSAIGKGRKNQQQGYSFRGVDDVYNALQPALIKNGLIIKPVTIGHNITQHESRNGGVLFRCIIQMEYTLYCIEDGSNIVCSIVGEAMDSGDKATNKAMSAAYKYMAFTLFCIPTEEAKDSENETHSVASVPAQATAMKPNPALSEKTTAKKEDDGREWLNLTNKNGSPNEKGETAKNYIRGGGKLSEITKKYKLNKADFAELAKLEKEVDANNTTSGERIEDMYHNAEEIDAIY